MERWSDLLCVIEGKCHAFHSQRMYDHRHAWVTQESYMQLQLKLYFSWGAFQTAAFIKLWKYFHWPPAHCDDGV